jgi:hypothetical protein
MVQTTTVVVAAGGDMYVNCPPLLLEVMKAIRIKGDRWLADVHRSVIGKTLREWHMDLHNQLFRLCRSLRTSMRSPAQGQSVAQLARCVLIACGLAWLNDWLVIA